MVDLYCVTFRCTAQWFSSACINVLFRMLLPMVYHRTLTIAPRTAHRTLMFIHPVCDSSRLLISDLPSIPPHPSPRWQQVCALWVCRRLWIQHIDLRQTTGKHLQKLYLPLMINMSGSPFTLCAFWLPCFFCYAKNSETIRIFYDSK